MSQYVLETKNLCKSFGGFVATNDVSIQVKAGARHALIGPNGAGKTTLINLLTGFLPRTSGSVELNGQDISHLQQHQRVKQGLVRTFQINQLFPDMTVLESVTMAVSERLGFGSKFWSAAGSYKLALAEASHILVLLRLTDVANVRTADLSYGKQRLVEISLALALNPKVLLLDEPAAGVPTGESRELFESIAGLPKEVTVLLVEHDMDLVFRFADRISVLVNGGLLIEGDPATIASHPLVKEVYLGEAQHG